MCKIVARGFAVWLRGLNPGGSGTASKGGMGGMGGRWRGLQEGGDHRYTYG